jgi:hypothetical protein
MNTTHLPDDCSEMSTINQDSLFNGLEEGDAIALYNLEERTTQRNFTRKSATQVGWQTTSPMGSVVTGNDDSLFVVEHDYDAHYDNHSDDHHGSLPYDSHDENSTDDHRGSLPLQ